MQGVHGHVSIIAQWFCFDALQGAPLFTQSQLYWSPPPEPTVTVDLVLESSLSVDFILKSPPTVDFVLKSPLTVDFVLKSSPTDGFDLKSSPTVDFDDLEPLDLD